MLKINRFFVIYELGQVGEVLLGGVGFEQELGQNFGVIGAALGQICQVFKYGTIEGGLSILVEQDFKDFSEIGIEVCLVFGVDQVQGFLNDIVLLARSPFFHELEISASTEGLLKNIVIWENTESVVCVDTFFKAVFADIGSFV